MESDMDGLIDRAKKAIDGYTDEDIAENEYLSFASAMHAAWTTAKEEKNDV